MGISNKDVPKAGDMIEGKYGTYTITERLGNGGNGTVFRGRSGRSNEKLTSS